jgi:hypothetical protein
MDDAKRRELEELRKQIDPEVLKRVAEAMGTPDAIPTTPTGEAKRRSSSSGVGLGKLKSRISQAEHAPEENKENVPEPIPVTFIIYDASHFKAKQLNGFLTRMGFENNTTCENPRDFLKNLVLHLNNPLVERMAIILYEEFYNGLDSLMHSEAVNQVKTNFPQLNDAPIFVVFDNRQIMDDIPGLNSNFILTLRNSFESNARRIKILLGLPYEDEDGS